jgi:hypothetical protein
VRKSMVMSGSQNRVQTIELSISQKVSVTNVTTDLNVLNGVYITKDSASGEDLLTPNEMQFVANVK